jgi:hypothetical protein
VLTLCYFHIAVDPLAKVTQAFREHLLEKSMYSLVSPRNPFVKSKSADVMQYTQLLIECSCISTNNPISAPSAFSIAATRKSIFFAWCGFCSDGGVGWSGTYSV